ncbi:hypothetical protein DQ04_06471080 [Trypanosoma grayi]|uniref:hypothetical protein n=1 Tax=Trypanosoma grayi TaxID=71804 RepID=UPI0004F49F19|nr:hypothetical protein DQ04_06471080 [Trypanosoma grayi]KEG08779.1 hypothetical protein DQ04_06471080 [Trypanosoma grayi]
MPWAVMMATLGRPALFVASVVLFCAVGCAAVSGLGDDARRHEVVHLMSEAKEKALKARRAMSQARPEMDAIKKATEQFKVDV